MWSRLFCGPLKMRSVEQDAVFALSKMHSVEQEAVLRTFEDASRTQEPFFVAECLRKRVAYQRSLFLVPNIPPVP